MFPLLCESVVRNLINTSPIKTVISPFKNLKTDFLLDLNLSNEEFQ